MKRKILFLACAVFILLMSSVTLAGWVQEGEFWKYEENGAFKTNEFVTIDNNIYYFDANSHMVTGLQKIGNSYHAFRKNGAAYKKSDTYTFNEIQYEIGGRGKVKDLENHITEEEYKAFVEQKAIEDANYKAFQEHQNILNESIAAVRKEQEALRAAETAALAAQKAIDDANKALAEEAAKARKQYLLSDENNQLISDAASRGTSSKRAVENMISEMKRQLNLRKIELVQKAKEIRTANPLADLNSVLIDFDDMITAYAEKSDSILNGLSYQYNLDNDKIEEYVEQCSIMLEEMKSSFDTMLDTSVG